MRARVVVNAAGVWSDDVRTLDEGAHPESIRPAKGMHITVPWEKVRNDIAAIVPVPKDRRSVFVVPWGDFTYVGTTDTDYDGPLDDPQCTPDGRRVPAARGEPRDRASPSPQRRVGTWAGLRPLLRDGVERAHRRPVAPPRRARVAESGVVTITGGKLTTYRRMAAGHDRQGASTSLGPRGRARARRSCSSSAREGYEAARRPRDAEPPRAPRRAATAPRPRAVHDLSSRPVAGRAAGAGAARTCRPRRSTRCATRWRARSTTCSPAGPARGCSAATRRRPRAEEVAALLAPELGWDAAEIARQVDDLPRPLDARARRRRAPRDRARRVARRVAPRCRRIAARRRRRSRSASPRREVRGRLDAPGVEVDDAMLRAARAARARRSPTSRRRRARRAATGGRSR